MREDPSHAFPLCDSCLYTCILGPRDCRCLSGAPGAGLWAVLGSPHAMTISSLFCSPSLSEGMPAGKCHSLETSESHKFSNKHECAHVLRAKGSARLQPEGAGRGRAGGKPKTGIGRAWPYRSGHGRVTPPAPAPVPACGLPRPAGRVSHSPGHRPAVAQTPCALDPCVQALVFPDPSDSGSHVPRTLRPLLSASLSPRAPYPQDTTYLDSKPLGPPDAHPAGTPYPWDFIPLGTSISTPAGPHTPMPQEPYIPVTSCSWQTRSLRPGTPVPPPPPRGIPAPPPRDSEPSAKFLGTLPPVTHAPAPGPVLPAQPMGGRGAGAAANRRCPDSSPVLTDLHRPGGGGPIKGPRGGARRFHLPPLHCGGHGTGGTAGPAGR